MSTWPVRPLVAYFALAFAITWGGLVAVVASRGFDLAIGRPVAQEIGVAR